MKKCVLTLLFLFLSLIQHVSADQQIIFGPETSSIKGSIKYTVVGRYRAVFDEYEGRILRDSNDVITSVFLEINAASIRSKHPSLDKVVRSKQLLYVEKFPAIIFQSKAIVKNGDTYQVVGELTLHGITKEIASPFIVERDTNGVGTIKGEWVIRRKDFGIIWNRFLDNGGILVGDHITVDWEISIPQGEKDEK